MSDLALDLDSINFDINNDYYDSLESLDQFLTNDFLQPFDDKFESTLSANTFHNNYQQTNNGFNPIQNQVFTNFNGYIEYNNNLFNNQSIGSTTGQTFAQNFGQNFGQTVYPTFGQTFGPTTGRIASASVNTIASISSTFGETIHQNHRLKESVFGHNSTVGYSFSEDNNNNNSNGQQNLFQQKTSQSLAKGVVETITNAIECSATELPEAVTLLNGRLITDEEFREQNHSELFCAEGMSENLSQSSFGSISPPLVIDKEPKKDKNKNKSSKVPKLISTNKSKQNPNKSKTYSRIANGKNTTLAAKPSDMSKETIAAVKGLVMLSNSCRPNGSIKFQRVKKGLSTDLSFAERQELKRERNRIAAKKCRQKKLETIEKLDQMRDVLIEENTQFEECLKNRRKQILDIKLTLLNHRLNGCQLQQK